MKIIELNIGKIRELCNKHKVSKLWVFGSILTPRFNDNSDIDFSVDFDSERINRENADWAECFFGLMHGLENITGRKVDLVDDAGIKNSYFRKELDDTKQLIYG